MLTVHRPAIQPFRACAALAAIALCVMGCGGQDGARKSSAPFAVAFGAGASYRPPSLTPAVARGRPVGRLRCAAALGSDATVHVELFAHGLGIVVPAGLGIAPPRRRDGAYVRSGRCSYPLRTQEPTGLVELRAAATPTLGDLFTLLGQPLSLRRLGAFRGPVRAWVDGRRWRGPLRALPLRHHGQVVVAAGTQPVPVHVAYRFPAGI